MLAHAHVCINTHIHIYYDIHCPSSVIWKVCNSDCYNRLFSRNTPFQASLNSKIILRCFYLLVFQEIRSAYGLPINTYVVTVCNAQAPVTACWFKSWVQIYKLIYAENLLAPVPWQPLLVTSGISCSDEWKLGLHFWVAKSHSTTIHKTSQDWGCRIIQSSWHTVRNFVGVFLNNSNHPSNRLSF